MRLMRLMRLMYLAVWLEPMATEAWNRLSHLSRPAHSPVPPDLQALAPH